MRVSARRPLGGGRRSVRPGVGGGAPRRAPPPKVSLSPASETTPDRGCRPPSAPRPGQAHPLAAPPALPADPPQIRESSSPLILSGSGARESTPKLTTRTEEARTE